MTTKKIFVTGAGGLIGSYAIKALYNQGMDVVGIYRNIPSKSLPWKFIETDLTSGKSWSFKVGIDDIIVHCAAQIPGPLYSDDLIYRNNTEIDENVLQTAIQKNANLIYLSSTSLYGLTRELIDESSTISIENLYSRAKYETEQKIISSNLKKKIILRVNAPYGPEQKNNTVLKIFIEKSIANENILYFGSGGREQDFTSAIDIANAIINCVKTKDKRCNGIFNISGNQPISMKSLAGLIIQLIPDCKSQILPSGKKDKQENYRARFSIEKAKDILKWQPEISLEDGVRLWINKLKNDNRNII